MYNGHHEQGGGGAWTLGPREITARRTDEGGGERNTVQRHIGGRVAKDGKTREKKLPPSTHNPGDGP